METSVLIRSLLAIALGASLGAILRWILGMTLNALFSTIPPGTWLANMFGGYLMGVALAYFSQHAYLAPEWRLFIITGFLGGLTTFSTFSAEVTTLIQQERILWAGMAISAHVIGSLLMTFLGLATYNICKHL
ncbi:MULTISPECIES: fluoride efflux transporter CrcB [Nitrosomonas]|uniref:Fluoride-specific ion channel FluC n=2 Tax=Nitrosomonas eutropha TaxID=916 RepID=A0ABX5M3Z5_9PROT|nr:MULTISPECIES: fluoride efflux transporter CrcB [Nitrosomonas]ABI59526.1 camphor resistance protein CrcB [Nitrosomonas eutropha C91]MXS79934.1 fluoride efflux transporter CrcB [Nitrosomonas sp. GH22]PXV76052.1 camphor resistance protein CrcB [Nitrosomonas eutropha]SDW02097.1 camphor resistance protein CrcB [Nitrosomonas eutropha]SEI78888.1 camphor resistance protein CrcB [Nitrosomonas eutropha]